MFWQGPVHKNEDQKNISKTVWWNTKNMLGPEAVDVQSLVKLSYICICGRRRAARPSGSLCEDLPDAGQEEEEEDAGGQG
jgi:hypothetical protein